MENVKLISIREGTKHRFDVALACLNSNKILPGTVNFWEEIDKKTGEIVYRYTALSRI